MKSKKLPYDLPTGPRSNSEFLGAPQRKAKAGKGEEEGRDRKGQDRMSRMDDTPHTVEFRRTDDAMRRGVTCDRTSPPGTHLQSGERKTKTRPDDPPNNTHRIPRTT